MGELLHKNATITWKTPKSIMTMSKVDIYDDGKAYRLSYDTMEDGKLRRVIGSRVWKKNVISIES
ncbi:hypothetical protein ACIQ1D_19655 [Lysinibacillus xylanilyticus]|uniref:hypothetical protein n=1 Tax=Lysinibacillus xylanilyticus TaxID=582475 RepID=UPI00382FD109